MTAASLFKSAHQNGLQPVDLGRHLGGIARLIELCFGAELDAGGRGLIREMQFLQKLRHEIDDGEEGLASSV